MKICVLKSVCPAFDPRIFHKELRALVKAGHEVTQICPYHKTEDFVDGIRLRGFSAQFSVWLRPLNWLRIASILRREPADLYYFSDPELLPMSLLLTWITGKPVVYDSFEHYEKLVLTDQRFPALLRPALARLYGFMETKVAERLAAVVVPAVDEVEGEKRFHNARHLVLVRNFAWLDVFPDMPAGIARKRQLVYIGDISEHRRSMSTLIDMLGLMRHQDVILLLIGKVDVPRTRSLLNASIQQLQLGDRVRFLEEVPHGTIKFYLWESVVGLVPLRPEPRWEVDIPQKMFEYMACELPFVASDLRPPRKFAEESGAGMVVEPLSAQAFADAVDFLLDHPEEAARMGRNGRRAFLERYNMDAESAKLVELLESLSADK